MKKALKITHVTAPVNVIVEFYGAIICDDVEINYTASIAYKPTLNPNNVEIEDIEIILMNSYQIPTGYEVKELLSAIEADVKKWAPIEILSQPQYKANIEIPAIPESMINNRYVFDDMEDGAQPITLGEVLQRFLNDPDEELLSPLGIYNLFMLKVEEWLPNEISVGIKRIA